MCFKILLNVNRTFSRVNVASGAWNLWNSLLNLTKTYAFVHSPSWEKLRPTGSVLKQWKTGTKPQLNPCFITILKLLAQKIQTLVQYIYHVDSPGFSGILIRVSNNRDVKQCTFTVWTIFWYIYFLLYVHVHILYVSSVVLDLLTPFNWAPISLKMKANMYCTARPHFIMLTERFMELWQKCVYITFFVRYKPHLSLPL